MPIVKKLIFTFITIFVVPLLFFVLLEFGLKLAGVGTSYDYFHKIDIEGQAHFQENPDFADQFYPPALNIGPLENTFTKERSPDLIRVYILGGSAAMGFPHKNHGVDRLLAAQLNAAFPTKTIEVINTAMTSVNSHVVYAVAKSLPKNSADFAVILMGNNEVVGPYGPGTFSENFLESMTAIRAIQALKRTRTWQALDGLINQSEPSEAKEDLKWQGMQMFTEHGVTHDDPRMESVYAHYERNLTDIIKTLRNKGMHVVLSSVPVNLRHSAPFLSVNDTSLSGEQQEEWRNLISTAIDSAKAANWNQAIGQLQAALAIDAEHADAHFRLATAYENLGNLRKAKSHYRKALDLDALRFRADTKINDIIQEVAASEPQSTVSFVDSAAAFEEASQPFQPGWNLLLEHVHYDYSGNHVLAAQMAASIAAALDVSEYSALSADEVAMRIGYPNHETIDNIRNLQGMIEHPPFPGQSNYKQFRRFLDDELARVVKAVGSPRDVLQRRQDVVRSNTADWKVYFELAALNRNLRNKSGMYFHLNKLLTLYPHNRESYMNMAQAMSQDGKWQEVIPVLERSLSYTRGDNKKIAETLNWLGTAYFRTGNYDEGTDLSLQVTREHSDQIYLTLKTYGNLIKYAKESGELRDLRRYAGEVQRYAEALIKDGKADEYPLLHTRVSQLMAMGGYTKEAQVWAAKKAQ